MNQFWEEKACESAKEFESLRAKISKKKARKVSPTTEVETELNLEDDKAERSKKWQEKLGKMREVYPKAFTEWTIEDDFELQDLFLEGWSVGDIVEKTGRQPGSVRARLKKNYGEELFSEGF